MLEYNKKLKENSRTLRKNMTDAERILWSKIKNKQIKGMQFYRQKIIGNYIVDFYCAKVNLVIELDGGQHYVEESIQKDKTRDEYLKSVGLKVLRFSNAEVYNNLRGIIQMIEEVEENPPTPFFKGGKEMKL